ncbi:DNA polymerase epsilon subunit 4 [Drosophila sulfurigaster albostrigata]|uniref:DNA polymerase epsilon subunit 4 n=1 Tax=Drosophila sulfurigaster albostrigata TaxID=89887 RepID=UPI002D218A8E|nr:DNA polymerase epsilon subunit 4 [Drosophila sulfurigaster albostrigata]
MASEDLFPNELTEETDLAQELQGSEELMDHENGNNDDYDDDEKATDEDGTTTNVATNGKELSKTTTNGGKSAEHEHEAKLTQLPMARIRNIMKLDPDLQIASNEAVFAVTRAVELFIESLARESFSYTAQSKKKTVQKRDVELAISAVDSLMFLDGAMNF